MLHNGVRKEFRDGRAVHSSCEQCTCLSMVQVRAIFTALSRPSTLLLNHWHSISVLQGIYRLCKR